jgi:hypothetical protein
MPLRKGTSKATTRQNFEEVGRGSIYRRTKRKYGKKRADRQRVAIVLNNKRKSQGRKAYKRKHSR